MLEYREKHRFFAQTQRGLEPVALEELEELGAVHCKESYCGVYFQASAPELYKINYCARTIMRVLAPLLSFPCSSDQVLYEKARRFQWSDLFTVHKTFAVTANVSNSRITHSRYAALKLKDAVADHFRENHGKRPNVDTRDPDVRLNLNIRENHAVISLDTSGESLHRRGYRLASVAAPMQETLAAAIVRLSGWQGTQPLIDPMCGSGTLLAEAMMKYCNIPPAFKRKADGFGFVHLPDYDPQVWKTVKREADENIRSCPDGLIKGCDIDPEAVKAARENLERIPGGFSVPVRRKDFTSIENIANHMIVTNPPYGVRMGEKAKLYIMYRQLGDFLKQQCKGSSACILCGDKELTKHIGLKISRRIPLYNGPLESRLVKIDVY
ncbi:MAG: class I SAM-dependent RNA methyltransferase [bacterium]|nr:class I SAM-dependent RNA methyltransferase [bacterium]